MKNVYRLTIILAFLICLSTFASAQQRTSPTRAYSAVKTQQKQQLYIAAKTNKRQIALLLPAVQAYVPPMTYRGPSLQKIVQAYNNQCNLLLRSKGRISNDQYANLETNFARLEKDLDRLIAHQNRSRSRASATQFAGNGIGLQGSRFSECFKDCHNSYPGTGGGNGANRFACKLGCFVEAGGGGNGGN
ncbi:MAG: hypothetical protein AAF705_08880 [Bacteroidota bacterium]